LRVAHRKLEIIHKGLGERVSIAERDGKIATNRLAKSEAALVVALATIELQTDELRNRLEKEIVQKKAAMEEKVENLEMIVRNDLNLLRSLEARYNKSKDEKTIIGNHAKNLEKEMIEVKTNLVESEAKLRVEAQKREKLELEAKRVIPDNIQISTLENKMSKMVGKVASAKNRITSLNSSTPYRPGAVERTLSDVMEDLRNV